jgi:hypothetical protein
MPRFFDFKAGIFCGKGYCLEEELAIQPIEETRGYFYCPKIEDWVLYHMGMTAVEPEESNTAQHGGGGAGGGGGGGPRAAAVPPIFIPPPPPPLPAHASFAMVLLPAVQYGVAPLSKEYSTLLTVTPTDGLHPTHALRSMNKRVLGHLVRNEVRLPFLGKVAIAGAGTFFDIFNDPAKLVPTAYHKAVVLPLLLHMLSPSIVYQCVGILFTPSPHPFSPPFHFAVHFPSPRPPAPPRPSAGRACSSGATRPRSCSLTASTGLRASATSASVR